ncbi:MAG: DUF4215 domain-containing protein [Nannocystaceae bacterium]
MAGCPPAALGPIDETIVYTSTPAPTTSEASTSGEPTTTETSASSDSSDSSDSDADSEVETDTEAPYCGDGIVDPDEECDDANNEQDDACVGCRAAFCGDGFIHAGVEECDDADDDPNDGCAACVADRLVFVTAADFPTDLGGLGGADVKCQTAAMDAGLPNAPRFRAWLASQDGSPDTRMKKSSGRYTLVTGLPIAQSWDDLTDGTLENPINVTELGALAEVTVFTNTAVDGTLHADPLDCAGWTSLGDEQHRFGASDATDSNWTHFDLVSPDLCGTSKHLYCFED